LFFLFVWVLHERGDNSKINEEDEKQERITYTSNYPLLLQVVVTERTANTDKIRKRLKLVTEGERGTNHGSEEEKKKRINMMKDIGREVKKNLNNQITP
jgi:hypothetical protein